MKDTTMKDLGMVNNIHLCNSCQEEMPECNPGHMIWGTGKGDDNVAACDIYNPCHVRNYEEERHNTLPKN